MFKTLMISLALAGMIVPTWSIAQAAPKRVAGERCAFPRVSQGTWVGFFDGFEEATDVFTGRDARRHITVWRCFRTKASCTAWKYWMQTDYRAGPQLTWCRKK